MKNLIICEGSTDAILLQYFMREVYHWEDVEKQQRLFGNHAVWFRSLKKEDNTLDIVSCKGSSGLLPFMEYAIELNKAATLNEAYNKIVLVTDRDEYDTEETFAEAIRMIFTEKNVDIQSEFKHNEWIFCGYESLNGRTRSMEVLLLVVPFEGNGAMETFLLNSISAKDTYDAKIIRQGNQFVDTVDTERRYLTQRRYITKAKFDVFFSIRTSAAQFRQRQDIIRGVKWEDYISTQKEFEKLGYLST